MVAKGLCLLTHCLALADSLSSGKYEQGEPVEIGSKHSGFLVDCMLILNLRSSFAKCNGVADILMRQHSNARDSIHQWKAYGIKKTGAKLVDEVCHHVQVGST